MLASLPAQCASADTAGGRLTPAQVEYWGVDTAFKGSVCVVTESTAGCQPGGPPFVHDESAVDPASGKPVCCQNPINGGFWMVRANPRGANLLRSWAARLFEDGVVQGKLFTGSAILDQEMLTVLVSSRSVRTVCDYCCHRSVEFTHRSITT